MLSSRLGDSDSSTHLHRSYRRDGTHQTPRTLPAMRTSTAMACRQYDRHRASARVMPSAVRP
eukprot:2854071-Prymnesium_polylepis.1